jgi:hypothetical protein
MIDDKSRLNQRFSALGVIVVWLCALSLLGICSCSGTKGEPQLSLPETTHDFGKISEEQSLTHTFVLQNTGTGTLEILEVEPDCTCTVPKYDAKIRPGSKGEVSLTLKPYSVLHDFRKETKVRTNDPKQPEVFLVLKGNSDPVIDIQPSHVIRLQGNPGQEVVIPVRITSRLPNPLKISYFQSSIPDKINVALKPEESGKSYVLTVTNKFKESGSYIGKIEVFTNSKERERLILRVFGDFPPTAASGSPEKPALPQQQGASNLK